MNEFDHKAAEWDKNRMFHERAAAVAGEIRKIIPLSREWRALEFGPGTGFLSLLLKDQLKEITLIDSSAGMVKVLNEKIAAEGAKNLMVLHLDLEHEDPGDEKYDLIYNLMVLHHVSDVEKIIGKFRDMLNPGGYLAVADLCSEDGSFHGGGFTGHRGFSPETLAAMLEDRGFAGISHKTAYVIDKVMADGSRKQFEVFLMTASLPKPKAGAASGVS
ncbi:MAG: class I SAM-dependent methyltransferase [Bacteroidales bacterium]|nr:class I SAM-dependent methyltransferase [Bacteroidales bacterium]MDT8373531.1 class I SAM-dependent methyltransferase [Bacteroidales bacterium]